MNAESLRLRKFPDCDPTKGRKEKFDPTTRGKRPLPGGNRLRRNRARLTGCQNLSCLKLCGTEQYPCFSVQPVVCRYELGGKGFVIRTRDTFHLQYTRGSHSSSGASSLATHSHGNSVRFRHRGFLFLPGSGRARSRW